MSFIRKGVQGGDDNVEEIIVIRAIDPDEDVFQTIMDALHGKSVQVAEKTSSMLSFGNVEIYPAYRRVLKAGEEIHLNHGEYSMLYCLLKSPGRVFTRDQLYAAAWDTEQHFGSNTVENTICRLRSKLEPDPRHPQYIKTVIGTGYKLVIPKR